jgi:hypothetical protein
VHEAVGLGAEVDEAAVLLHAFLLIERKIDRGAEGGQRGAGVGRRGGGASLATRDGVDARRRRRAEARASRTTTTTTTTTRERERASRNARGVEASTALTLSPRTAASGPSAVAFCGSGRNAGVRGDDALARRIARRDTAEQRAVAPPRVTRARDAKESEFELGDAPRLP